MVEAEVVLPWCTGSWRCSRPRAWNQSFSALLPRCASFAPPCNLLFCVSQKINFGKRFEDHSMFCGGFLVTFETERLVNILTGRFLCPVSLPSVQSPLSSFAGTLPTLEMSWRQLKKKKKKKENQRSPFHLKSMCWLKAVARITKYCVIYNTLTWNWPYKRHELVIKLLIKQVEDRVGLLNDVQEVQVGILGIWWGDRCRSKRAKTSRQKTKKGKWKDKSFGFTEKVACSTWVLTTEIQNEQHSQQCTASASDSEENAN